MNPRSITRREASRRMAIVGCALLLPRAREGPYRQPGRAEDEESAKLTLMLERVRSERGLPGLAAAIVRGNRETVKAVAGVRRWGHAASIEPDDRFHIASCTKSWTATLAAAAVMRGEISWTTTLETGLPGLAPRMRKEYRTVTLEQLLAHEGKLPAYTQPGPRLVEELQALAGTGAEQRLSFLGQVLKENPNEATGDGAYSNAGYSAAAALLEAATKSGWEALVRRDIAGPLGLRTVGFGYPATAEAPDQVRGHAVDDSGVTELSFDKARQLAACLWPAGAIHCSIGDLAVYAADHLNGLLGRKALLTGTSYERLHRRRGESVFTLGWGVASDKTWGTMHFGAGSGGWFFVRIVILPEHDTAVVIASNSGGAGPATRELWPELIRQFGKG